MCYPKSKIIRDCIWNDNNDQLTQDNHVKCKFNATYHVVRPFDKNVYANVYCVLCNNENWIKDCKFESESVKALSDLVFLLLDLIEDTVIYNKKVMVTKISFCNLIKHETSKYTENFDEITLTASNKNLDSGEYIKVVGQNVEVRVRISQEDLYLPLSVASRTEYHDWLCLALALNCVCLSVWLYCV